MKYMYHLFFYNYSYDIIIDDNLKPWLIEVGIKMEHLHVPTSLNKIQFNI